MFALALAVTLSVESAFAAAPAQPAPLDADNLGEAVGMVAVENRAIELSRKFCNEQFPELRRQVDSAAVSWRDRNQAEVRDLIAQKMDDSAASKIAATAAFAAIHALSRDQQQQYCMDFAAGVPDGARDVSARTPRASQFLKEHLKAHPLSEQQGRICLVPVFAAASFSADPSYSSPVCISLRFLGLSDPETSAVGLLKRALARSFHDQLYYAHEHTIFAYL
jgi:hypothetical protein